MKDIGALSNRNRIMIFRAEFPVLPRKISEYLRTELSSDANMRIIKNFYKVLNINELCLRVFFRIAKSTISACEMGHFRVQYGAFRPLK